LKQTLNSLLTAKKLFRSKSVELERSFYKNVSREADNALAMERENNHAKEVVEIEVSIAKPTENDQVKEDRLKELMLYYEAKVSELENGHSESRSVIASLRQENEILIKANKDLSCNIISSEKTISDYKAVVSDQKQQCINLKERYEQKARTKEEIKKERKVMVESLVRQWRDHLESQKEFCNHKERYLTHVKEIIPYLDAEKSHLTETFNDLNNMVNTMNIKEKGIINGEINLVKERLKSNELKSTASAEKLKFLGEQLRDGHAERCRIHNVIQDLRGNVRVFARVRPFLPSDGADSQCVFPINENSLRITQNKESAHDFIFEYDRVFSPCSTQDAIFQEVSEFVQSALDGYNVCLFSYGETGSGKTHTMQGSEVGEMRGIIPRAIEQVGHYKDTLERGGWRYTMKVSFLEIYNEVIRDLLREENSEEQRHEIRLNSDNHRYITNLTLKPLELSNLEDVRDTLSLAAKNRSVASTDMNSVSSRSHSVFTLHLTAMHSEQKKSIRGTLNLVDLAGSERLSRCGATGDRAKESISINKSLSSLTDVFVSIRKKSDHIPFRNSKLTYLLQPCLSGFGKMLMIVNVSPSEESYQETLSSLRFASNVNNCQLGKAKKIVEEIKTINH